MRNNLSGTALEHLRKGRLNQAERIYNNLLRKSPANAESLHGLGIIAHRRGYHRKGARLIGHATAVCPDVPLFYINHGIVLAAAGEHHQALAVLLGAARRFRSERRYRQEMAEIHSQLGELYAGFHRFGAAGVHLKHAARLQPNHLLHCIRLGRFLIEQGDLDAAAHWLGRAIQIRPGSANVWNMLGRMHQDSGELEKAGQCYQQAIGLDPRHPEAYCNYGNLLLETGSVQNAVSCLRKALRINPEYADAFLNLAVAFLDLGALDGARDHFRYACQLSGNSVEHHGYWAQALLSRGYLSDGWLENEWRLKSGKRIVTDVPTAFWDGTTLSGRTVLVLAEQGIGDQIMFASCLQDLLDKARPDTCTVECDSRLAPLYRRSFPSIQVQAQGRDEHGRLPTLPRTDTKVAIGSLPRLFRPRIQDFPRHTGYLLADPQRVALWKARYRSLAPGRWIGISWRGGGTAQRRRQRSATLAQWAPLLATPGIAFTNLQYGDSKRELADVNAGGKVLVHDWPDTDPLTDLDDFAARIAALDLVISVDNCTVHMAGALGTPVWTLIPFTADWRWGRGREDSPWYPAMLLFRQTEPGNWAPVFHRIAKLLQFEPTATRP